MAHNELVMRIERLLGTTVESYRVVSGGYSPALRLVCQTSRGNLFAKVGSTPLTSAFLRNEAHTYSVVRGPFIPKLIAWDDDETTPILVIEDLSSFDWPPPWNQERIDRVLAQIHTMHSTPAALQTYDQIHEPAGGHWQAVAADPAPFLSLGMVDAHWLDIALLVLIAQEAQCSTAGDALTHWDVRSDNICFSADRTLLIDWNWACLSNPKLDLGFWLPSLQSEGGPAPETILPDAPEVAAWVAGFFAARAGLPTIPDAPRVRMVQRQQLVYALPWALRALDLPPIKLS